MIRIGKLTDYAMLVMSQMAKEQKSVLSATMLAEALHLSTPTVSKVLKMLADAGLLSSIRGADGGYRLAKNATDVSVADIIAAMEGDLAMTECCDTVGRCAINGRCTMRDNWLKINKKIYSVLAGISIDDMLKPLSFNEEREVHVE